MSEWISETKPDVIEVRKFAVEIVTQSRGLLPADAVVKEAAVIENYLLNGAGSSQTDEWKKAYVKLL